MLLEGKKVAAEIEQELKEEVSKLKGRRPCIAVILVGTNPASEIYVHRKTQACGRVGIHSIKKNLPATISAETLLKEVEKLNADDSVDGILVQLPLPPQINSMLITQAISPHKDVDGFHPENMGKLLTGDPSGFSPCTPLGIKVLLDRYHLEVTGKHVLILGRSNIVGKPLAAMLMQRTPSGNATVTVAHSQTKKLVELCRMADIVIAAIGQPRFVKPDMIKEGAIVIDVGINKIESAATGGPVLVGDVDFEAVKDKCSAITPVPGGVGPMTIAMLLHNTLESYKRRVNP